MLCSHKRLHTVLVLIACNLEMFENVAQWFWKRLRNSVTLFKTPIPVTSHVAIRDTSRHAQFPYLNTLSTGTVHCSCIHQIDQQQLPVLHLLASSRLSVNEHQVTNVALHTNHQQITINEQTRLSKLNNQNITSVIEMWVNTAHTT